MDSFRQWWQHLPEHMDPVIFQIGSFRLQYYGLMYLVAFGLTYFLAMHRIKHEDKWEIDKDGIQGMMMAMIIGLIVGARLGYVFFYQPGHYLQHPLEIIMPFNFNGGFHFTGISGMSYHGGLIGSIIGATWFTFKHRLNFRRTVDLFIPCIPAGYTFGRLGNFINGELWGRVTTAPIGMYFNHAPGNELRHPSQLYEAFGEGIVLFVLLWLLRNRFRTAGLMLPLYLLGYGIVRFIIEYFREPDDYLGFVFLSFSMGQLLCSAMIAASVILWVWFNITGSKSKGRGK